MQPRVSTPLYSPMHILGLAFSSALHLTNVLACACCAAVLSPAGMRAGLYLECQLHIAICYSWRMHSHCCALLVASAGGVCALH